jgi:hypothetical protein
VSSREASMALEDLLRSELRSGPSSATAAAIDRRVSAAIAGPAVTATAALGLRRFAVAPIMAVLGILVVSVAIAVAAMVLTAEDQRVLDLTACMREQGWNVADADLNGGTAHVVPGFSTIVDASQQDAFNAALEVCAATVGVPALRAAPEQ